MKSQSSRVKLKNVTFTINDKPMDNLMWANKQKRASKCKPAKINGVLVSQVQPYYGQLS